VITTGYQPVALGFKASPGADRMAVCCKLNPHIARDPSGASRSTNPRQLTLPGPGTTTTQQEMEAASLI